MGMSLFRMLTARLILSMPQWNLSVGTGGYLFTINNISVLV